MESIKSDYIINEINNSMSQIENNKTLAISAIKMYFIVFFGLFAYAAFLQTKVINDTLPNDIYLMYSIFGVILTLMTAVSGWILLDYVTGLIYKAIINYTHIGYMRNMVSKTFFENNLKEHFILPIGASEIHLKRSRHLPIAFSAINLLLLLMNYYYLQISLEPKTSLTITYFILFIFLLFFPNACKKLEEEKTIAKRLKPKNNDEEKARKIVNVVKKQKRETTEYKFTFWTVVVLASIFLLLLVYNLFHCANNNLASLSNWIFIIEAIILFVITPLVYYLTIIETKFSAKRKRGQDRMALT